MAITESIGAKIVSLLSGVVSIALAEEQTEEYPYAVYEQTVQPILDKSAPVAYESDTTIYVYSKDFDEADALLQSIKSALAEGMDGEQFYAIPQSEQKDCVDEVWNVSINYRIIQTS